VSSKLSKTAATSHLITTVDTINFLNTLKTLLIVVNIYSYHETAENEMKQLIVTTLAYYITSSLPTPQTKGNIWITRSYGQYQTEDFFSSAEKAFDRKS